MFGFFLVDKPAGMTSRELVVHVRRRLRELGSSAGVGHCGTLDPLATGLMVLAIGPATALTPWFQGGNKRYRAKFRWGVCSESLDLETPLSPAESIPPPSAAELAVTCRTLTGSIRQQPPKFSAVHVQGKRAYQWARQGRDVEMPWRTVHIHHLAVTELEWPEIGLEIHCSGGTYIRTLGDDLAKQLGTRAVMTELRRTRSSGLDLKDARTLDWYLTEPDLAAALIPVAEAMGDFPRVSIDLPEAKRFRNGLISHVLQERLESEWRRGLATEPAGDGSQSESSGEVLVLLEDQRPVGIAYRRPKPGRSDHWRIKLNLAQWLEPHLF